jgi:hypothetical protein
MQQFIARIGVMLAATLLTVAALESQTAGDRLTVPFSDPSRPGTVRVNAIHSGIVVKGSTGRDVVIRSMRLENSRPSSPPPADAGRMRRLSPPRGVTVQEENNVISIRSEWVFPTGDIEIGVPSKTNLSLHTVTGEMTVEDVDGEIEVNDVNGSIKLTNVSGSIVAHTTNGKVAATVTRVTPDRPMAFTALNGTVDVTLPASLKADLKLRSNFGDVFSDFDVQLKPPPASTTNAPPRNARYRIIYPDRSVYGAVNGGGPLFELRTVNGNVDLRRGR